MKLLSTDFRTFPSRLIGRQVTRQVSAQTSECDFRVDPMRVARALGWTAAFLVAASVLGQTFRLGMGREYVFGFVPQFNLDGEHNIPSFFSALLLLFAAGLLLAIGYVKKQGQAAYATHWTILGVVFAVMSVDEITSMHEMLIDPLRQAFGTSGIFHYAWVLAAIPFVTGFGLSYLGFLFHLAKPLRKLFLIAAGLYIGGALGMELAGGWYADRFGVNTAGYVALTTVEESLELAGAITFVYALLRTLSESAARLSFRLREGEVNPPPCPAAELS